MYKRPSKRAAIVLIEMHGWRERKKNRERGRERERERRATLS